MKKTRIAIFISGRGSNMKAILDNVKNGNLKDCCEVALVFSNNKEAKGLEAAKNEGFETLCVESKGKKRKNFDNKVIQKLEPYNIEYIVLAGYMRILSPVFINRYRNRIINIHPADTTLYQGIHGYDWAFKNQLKTTKITVHLVDEGVDTGKIIAQREINLRNTNSLEEIENLGLQEEHKFYSKVLEKIFKQKLLI